MLDDTTPALTPRFSIVVPCYNEEGNIEQLYLELMKTLPIKGMSYEIVFSDDGSSDKTWEKILDLHTKDPTVKGVRLSRNFGHQYALLAGISQASGNAIITMDADLQHPPELIPKLVEAWEDGHKIVNTIRLDSGNVSYLKEMTSKLFYKVFSFLSGVRLESGMADFRLMDKEVVKSLLSFKEEGIFFRGLVQWVGFPSKAVSFDCRERFSGSTKYTLKKMLKLAFDGITSFSLVPLRLSIFVGILTSLIAFAEMFYAIYIKLFTDQAVPGWASAIVGFSFLFGILFILLGLIGEYIGRILIEVRQRPRFLLRDKIGLS